MMEGEIYEIYFDFLIRKFVKDYKNVSSQSVRQSYGTLGGNVGIIINSSILVLEIFVFDVVLDKTSFKDNEKKELQGQIQDIIYSINPSYRSIITFDREFY